MDLIFSYRELCIYFDNLLPIRSFYAMKIFYQPPGPNPGNGGVACLPPQGGWVRAGREKSGGGCPCSEWNAGWRISLRDEKTIGSSKIFEEYLRLLSPDPPPERHGSAEPGITHGREPVRSFRYPHLKPGSLPVRPGLTDSYSRDLKSLAREAQVKPLLP